MSKNIREIPYTEIQERITEYVRIDDSTKRKVRGITQDVYVREIPSKFDWDFLKQSSSLTTIAEYKVGTVSVNTGANSLTFSSDAALTSSMTGRKIKIAGNGTVYGFNFSNTTAGTVNPTFQGNSNASSQTYSIFQPSYALSPDFDRFPMTFDDDGEGAGIYRWEGGKKRTINPIPLVEANEESRGTPSSPSWFQFADVDTAGTQRIEFIPAPNKAENYGYDYIKQLRPLIETSFGTATVSAKGTTVTGAGSLFTEATTGDFIRFNDLGTADNSSWYRIIAIAHDSSLTLGSQFASTGMTNASYVISRAPEMPVRMHPAVLYGTVRNLGLDQNDEGIASFGNLKTAEVLSDSKRIHVSRIYSKKVPTIAEEFLYRR